MNTQIQTKSQIPIQVLIDIVHPNNKWELVCLQSNTGNRFLIRKGIYYYTLNDITFFRNYNFRISQNENLQVDLGEFRPLISDMMYLTLLPIGFNGNEFIVNIRTKIVYIKPKNVTLMLPKNSEYNFDIFKDYFYGGIFNQYLNSDNHTGQLFISIIPNYDKHQSINHPNKPSHIKLHETKQPIPNNYQDNFNNQLNYDKKQISKSLLGDKLLMKNEYVAMEQPQKFNINKNEKVIGVNKITFLVPFLEKHNNNMNQLVKTLWSLINNVDNKEIIVVTNKDNFELPTELVHHISVYRYNYYVGSLGFENRLNILMKNGFDLASFYNNIISTLVKTDSFIIWKYNWELINIWNITEVNVSFPIFNYYNYSNTEYKSRTYTFGILLDNKRRFVNTPDFMNVYIPNINNTITNLIIPIKSIYNIDDYLDIKNRITYEDNKEIKEFYENIEKNIVPDFIQSN